MSLPLWVHQAIRNINKENFSNEQMKEIVLLLGGFWAGSYSKEEFENTYDVELDYKEYRNKDSVSVFSFPE